MLRTEDSFTWRLPYARFVLLLLMAIPTPVMAQGERRPDPLPEAVDRPDYRRLQQGNQNREPSEFSDLRLQRVYESALSILERGDLVNGLPLLQSILDHPRDTLYYVDPQDRDRAVSLKGLVLERLNTLPESGLEQYNVLYNQAAQEILEHSGRRSAQSTLEEVVRRYYFTETGRRAALRLAKMYFDRGNFLAAGLTFQRLLDENRVPRRDRPLVLLQTAVALRLTGLDQKCREILKQLEGEAAGAELQLGGATLSVNRDGGTLQWLDQIIAPEILSVRQDPQSDWLMFRGDSQRNADASGATPLREQPWEFRTIPLSEIDDPRQLEFVERELQTLKEKFADSHYLSIPAVHPLIVGDRIIVRSIGNLKAIDLRTGVIQWETLAYQTPFLGLMAKAHDSLLNNGEQVSLLQEYLMQHTWRDLTSGTLTSDGTYLYSVEEQGPEHSDSPAQRARKGEYNNRLIAYELESGKAVWTLSTPSDQQERFLGPPLVQGDILYCLLERNEAIHLVALKNRELPDGHTIVETLWEQPLPLPVSSELDSQMPLWRLSGLSPSYANGMLICPIAHGTVVAYDLARGILSWQYRYPGEQAPSRVTMNRLNRIRERYGISREDEERWLDHVPTIVQGRILLTPCDSPDLHCLNLSTGTPLWTVPRGNDLYLATVKDDEIVLVGRDQIHARSLETGAELWSVPLPMPSGRGFASGPLYHVPLSTAAIAVIDLERGELRAIIPSQRNRVPGNLVAANGFVVSQTEDRVFRFLTEEEMQTQLSTQSDAIDSRILRGERALLEQRMQEAVSEFVSAYREQPDPRLHDLLVQTLFEALRTDFDDFKDYVPELNDLTRGTSRYPEFQEILASGLAQSGQSVEAFSQFLSLLDQPLTRLDQRVSRSRSDVWTRGHLRELYDQASNTEREAMDEIVQQKVEQILDTGNQEIFARAASILQDFPGSLELQRARLAQLNEYTESLALELLLMRLSESSDESLRREAVGRHFQLLMKLERIEQAAIVREELLSQYGDEECVDGMTGAELAAWGLENRLLKDYLTRSSHVWDTNNVSVSPARVRPDSPVPDLYHIPVAGDPGLFAGWTFHFTNQKPPRLRIEDEMGNRRADITLDAFHHDPSDLSLKRAVYLQGHLGVLVLADRFFVLDLFQDGGKAFLHGPHRLNEMIAGLEVRDIRESVLAETVRGPNGHPQRVVRDLYNERMGQIASVTTERIIYQRDRELVAIESLTGEELWSRQIGQPGQLLAGDGRIVACRPAGQRTVSTFRAIDGTPAGQFRLPQRHYVLAVHGRILVVLELDESSEAAQPQAENDLPPDRWRLTAYDCLSQEAIWTLPVSAGLLVQSADLDHLAVIEGETREFRFIRIKDGEVLSRHKITVDPAAVQEQETQSPENAEENEDRQLDPSDDIIAFWISRSQDGYLLTTVDRAGGEGQVSVRSLAPDQLNNPPVHGEVLQLDRNGKPLWQRRVENQRYDPEQPLASPVVVFLARHIPNRRRFITSTNKVSLEILSRETGEQLYELREIERHSQLETTVLPEQQKVKISGDWNSYEIHFSGEPPADPPDSDEESP